MSDISFECIIDAHIHNNSSSFSLNIAYNTLINALAKSSDGGSASRAEEILKIMEEKYSNGDSSYKPNTRSHTSVIDAWAKSGEAGAARRAEMILNNLRNLYEATGDPDIKPNVYTANAVMNVSFPPVLSYGSSVFVSTALMIQNTLFYISGVCFYEARGRSRRGTRYGLPYLRLARLAGRHQT